MKKTKSGNLKRKKQKIKKVWENCVIRLNDGFFIIEKCVDVRKYVGIAGYSASLRNDSLKSWFHRKYCKTQIVIKIKRKYNQETSTLLLWNISFPHKAHSPYCYYFTEKYHNDPQKQRFFMCAENILIQNSFSVTFSDFFTFTVWVFFFISLKRLLLII